MPRRPPPPDSPVVTIGERVIVANDRPGEPKALPGVVVAVHPDGACVALDPFTRDGRTIHANQFARPHQIQKPAGRVAPPERAR